MRTVAAMGGVLPLLTVLALPAVADSFSPERFGIGAYFAQADSVSPVVLLQCTPRGPADRAGLLPGDVVLELDGLPARGWRLTQVLDRMISARPGPISLTVRRDSLLLSMVVHRQRFVDIAAGADLKYVLDADSTTYQPVPLNEADPWQLGRSPDPVEVVSTSCTSVLLELPSDRPALMYFWASWCPPCKDLIARLKSDPRALESRQVVALVGVNLDNDCQTFREWVSRLDPPGEQYWARGWRGQVAQLARVYRRGIPAGVLLDRGRRIRRVTSGRDSILTALEELATGYR